MEPRNLEKKGIEDKKSRKVAFSKRRTELNKTPRQLSNICDVDAPVVGFSSRGKLFEYSSGSTDSVELMLSRYQKRCLEAEEGSSQELASKDMGNNNQGTRFRTCKELLESVRRLDEEPNAFSVTEMTELEEELTTALMQTRSRKFELMMETLSILREQERKLMEENEKLKQQVALARKQNDVVDDGGGLDAFATIHPDNF